MIRNIIHHRCSSAAALPLQAAPRPWKSVDGERSVQGEFVKRDAAGVTIRRSDGKEVTIPFDMLHSDDLHLAQRQSSRPGNRSPRTRPPFSTRSPSATPASRSSTSSKPASSSNPPLDDIFLGRSGLNGVFRTRKKIGGIDTMLYFDWTERRQLKEILLQTATYPASASRRPAHPLLEGTHRTAHHPQRQTHPREQQVRTRHHRGRLHVRHPPLETRQTGSAVLGAAREGDKYQVVVRFTQEDIKPVIIPAPTPMSVKALENIR